MNNFSGPLKFYPPPKHQHFASKKTEAQKLYTVLVLDLSLEPLQLWNLVSTHCLWCLTGETLTVKKCDGTVVFVVVVII